MPGPERLRPDERRSFAAFAGAARAVLAAVDRDLERDVGMPRAYVEILHHLSEAPGGSLRMSDLAEAMRSQPSRITHAVARLEEAGRVRRELCIADRRGWFAVLTEDGRKALDAAAPYVAESVRRQLFAHLSAADRRELTRIGEQLLAGLDAAEPPKARALAGMATTTDAKER